MRTAIWAVLAVAACGDNLVPDRGPDLALHDEIFASARDHGVLCAANSDDRGFREPSIEDALDRARDRGEIVQLFTHDPGHTISLHKLEAILAGARDRGLRFVTYRELAGGERRGPGIALAFDDWAVDDWAAARPLLAQYGARVTFFPALYTEWTDAQRAELAALAADGHDIEYHGTYHFDAVGFVAQYGMDAYVSREIRPALTAMRADGYDPIVFAYPAGLRSAELDSVLLGQFTAVRATTMHCPHMDE